MRMTHGVRHDEGSGAPETFEPMDPTVLTDHGHRVRGRALLPGPASRSTDRCGSSDRRAASTLPADSAPMAITSYRIASSPPWISPSGVRAASIRLAWGYNKHASTAL